MPVVNCYKASIKKTSYGYRIYLISSYERGGDTEIKIFGDDISIKREDFTMKRGVAVTKGWRIVQVSEEDPEEKVI